MKKEDHLKIRLNKNKETNILPTKTPRNETWFWTKEWQKGEKEADQNIKDRDIKQFHNIHDAIKWLNSNKADRWIEN